MMGDAFSSSANASGENAEYYVLPKGFSGDYRVMVRRVWGEVTGGKVTVEIYNHFRKPNQGSQRKQVAIDETGALVLFSLEDGRRNETLNDRAIQTVAEAQIANTRQLLTEQLDESYSSKVASDYLKTRQGGDNQRALGRLVNKRGLAARQLGYQPVITQLPSGASMQVQHATTADRLHVLVSPSPFFSQIQAVETFNILDGGGGAGGVGGGVGGAGGGIGGVGGGIGGVGGGAGGVGGGLF